jgi:hypothetical protein
LQNQNRGASCTVPEKNEKTSGLHGVPERMALARAAGAQTLDFKAEDIYIQELTHGRGADAWHKNIQHTVRYTELSPERFLERLNSVTIRNFTDTLHVTGVTRHGGRSYVSRTQLRVTQRKRTLSLSHPVSMSQTGA